METWEWIVIGAAAVLVLVLVLAFVRIRRRRSHLRERFGPEYHRAVPRIAHAEPKDAASGMQLVGVAPERII